MWTEDRLNEMLTTPSAALVEDMKRIKGDIMILGAGACGSARHIILEMPWIWKRILSHSCPPVRW